MNTKLTDVERQRIRIALVEDAGRGDPTTEATVPEDMQGFGKFLAKADGIIAGVDIARHTFMIFEDQTGTRSAIFEFQSAVEDGASVTSGTVLATVRANMRTLLSAERVALNLMQRMSGIATMTNEYVKRVEGTKATILDTRKTAPLLRPFDRYAVRLGGAQNHRYSLSEMILIKDNHIAANHNSISKTLEQLHTYFAEPERSRLPVEIEVTSLDQLREVIAIAGKNGQYPGLVNRVLFDNFTIDTMREAVQINNGMFETEGSGGVSLDNVRAIAETGVDFISVGALTHSVKGFDISLEIE